MNYALLPTFDNLPAVPGMPQGCAWGIFDRNGTKDLLGTLNLLTPEVVRTAKEEVIEGISVSLNWPLEALEKNVPPFDGRRPAKHTVFSLQEGNISHGIGWDDELEFNTQGSSQWDSLLHWQHQESGLAYNGFKPTKKALMKNTTAENTMPTLDHWHPRGGLVGRGVLIDYKAYAEKMGIDFHPLSGHRITVNELEMVAAYQKVEFKPGDILLVRTGLTEVYENPKPKDFEIMKGGKVSGVHGTVETARWVWNKHFAAAVSDSNAFEAYPPVKPDGTIGSMTDLVLHQWFLSLFGLPIGELWDLKRLSAQCKKSGRYSFMITSAPMNAPGLIGSPPNALAIF